MMRDIITFAIVPFCHSACLSIYIRVQRDLKVVQLTQRQYDGHKGSVWMMWHTAGRGVGYRVEGLVRV